MDPSLPFLSHHDVVEPEDGALCFLSPLARFVAEDPQIMGVREIVDFLWGIPYGLVGSGGADLHGISPCQFLVSA